MLDALIFDFDGIVVDSEPIHLEAFRAVLAKRQIALTDPVYYDKYVGFDDHDCFAAVLADNARPASEADIAAMTAEKTALIQVAFAGPVAPLPGVIELMRAAHDAGVAVAICSGALRAEIELAGKTVGALPLAHVLVAARDVVRGKPDPEGYLLSMQRLAEALGRPIAPERTWVIEDSVAGVEAGRRAGCKVLAVTNTYDRAALAAADRVVDSLAEVDLPGLEAL